MTSRSASVVSPTQARYGTFTVNQDWIGTVPRDSLTVEMFGDLLRMTLAGEPIPYSYRDANDILSDLILVAGAQIRELRDTAVRTRASYERNWNAVARVWRLVPGNSRRKTVLVADVQAALHGPNWWGADS